MLYDKIIFSIKDAMKSKNKMLKEVLKEVQSKAQAIAKENKVEINDDIVVDAINKEIKQLQQTLDSIQSHPDSELFKVATEKIDVLKGYLPEQLSEEDIEKEILRIQADNKELNKGRLTGIIMNTLKGKAANLTIKKVIDRVIE